MILSNKTSDSWHLLHQYTQAGLFFFLHVGLSLWKLNQRCPSGCPFARDHEIVPLSFACSSSSDWTRHTASKLRVTSLFVTFQRAYGYIEKNGPYSHSWDSLYGKKHCVFLPLILILQLGVKGGTTPANSSSLGPFKSPSLGIMSKRVFVHTPWVGFSHNFCKSCIDSSSCHLIY